VACFDVYQVGQSGILAHLRHVELCRGRCDLPDPPVNVVEIASTDYESSVDQSILRVIWLRLGQNMMFQHGQTYYNHVMSMYRYEPLSWLYSWQHFDWLSLLHAPLLLK
jgi:hypothetical protein